MDCSVMETWERGLGPKPGRRGVLLLVVVCSLIAPLSGCAYEALFPPLPVVERVELERFIGKWYEIAKYPNFFQQQCYGGTTAAYGIREDGNISVLNTCREGSLDGPESRIEGYATIADPTTNAKLSVVFFPPFGAPYWIIDLDPDYQWAVIGEPSRSTLWILSRTPTMDEATYEAILARLPIKGYDPARLKVTPQRADDLGSSRREAGK